MEKREKEEITIEIKVKTNAKTTEYLYEEEGIHHINISAQPIEGKANETLIAFIAKRYGVKKSNVEIIRGKSSTSKVLKITKEKETDGNQTNCP